MASVSIKWNHDGAYRRFAIPIPANGDLYGALMTKVCAVEPGFNDSLAWKDEEGDSIVFCSTTELNEAISRLKQDEPLRIYTVRDDKKGSPAREAPAQQQEQQQQQQQQDQAANGGVEHPNVVCDGCDAPIRGIRYKCMNCIDFDLCSTCEKAGKHLHHPMARIADPNDRTWMAHHMSFMRKLYGGRRHHPFPHYYGHWWRQNVRGGEQEQSSPGRDQAPQNGAGRIPPDFINNGLDFLREVGMTVADALTNLGIAVDVDVEHDGHREKVHDPKKTDGQQTTEQQQQQQQPQQPSAPENRKPEEAHEAMEHQPIQQQNEAAAQPVGQQTVAGMAAAVDKVVVIDSNSRDGTPPPHDWTMIEQTETTQPHPPSAPPQETVGAQAQQQPAQQQQAQQQQAQQQQAQQQQAQQQQEQQMTPVRYPELPMTYSSDPTVNQTLMDLLSMGFDNQDGWLLQLIEAKHGDINAVLNALDPAATRRGPR